MSAHCGSWWRPGRYHQTACIEEERWCASGWVGATHGGCSGLLSRWVGVDGAGVICKDKAAVVRGKVVANLCRIGYAAYYPSRMLMSAQFNYCWRPGRCHYTPCMRDEAGQAGGRVFGVRGPGQGPPPTCSMLGSWVHSMKGGGRGDASDASTQAGLKRWMLQG